MKTWLHIVSYDPSDDKTDTVATCVLADGKVTCEGDPLIVARLESGLFSVTEGRQVTEEDGEAFLTAIGAEFRAPNLFATGIMSGDDVMPYERPAQRRVDDAA